MSQFEYVAVLVSIIVGLALTQILRGIGRMVTTEDGPRPYWVHLVWTFYLFLLIGMFWWWEFSLGTVEWSLAIYIVVIVYATLLFFVSLVIQPSETREIINYKDYFFSNRRWIFGLLMTIWLWDFVDTFAKGTDHFASLSIEYLVYNTSQIVGCAIGIKTANERYHEIFSVVFIVYFVTWMYRNFFVIN